jgi:hypothetical protein
MPSHCSHKTQLCDVGVFGLLKTAYRPSLRGGTLFYPDLRHQASNNAQSQARRTLFYT